MANESDKPVGIVGIAEQLGVSKTTVGYVLSGQAKKRRVAEKTAERVLETAKRLNYVPHLWARNLARQRTGAIGVVIAGYEYEWATEVMRGALPALEVQDYLPFTSIHQWNRKRMEKELMLALARRDEAIICQPLPQCNDSYTKVMEYGTPLVFISDTLEDMPQASYVVWDSLPAVRTAVQYLIKTGRSRIGYIGFDLGLRYVKARYHTFRDVLASEGLELNENWIELDSLERWQSFVPPADSSLVEKTVERLFTSGKPRPEALFFPHDTLAFMAIKKLNKMGVRIPDDVALMGMGDVPLSDDFGVGLSTVHEPLEEIGRVAAEMVIELIKEPDKGPLQRLIPGTELKIRRTT
jgi:DNA-binding LacI/PurR family transcriptional regulator